MRRTLSCLAAGVVLLSLSLSQAPARADDTLAPSTSIALAKMYGSTSLLAASGHTLVRTVWSGQARLQEYSLNDGKTWRSLPAALAGPGGITGYRGRFYKLHLTMVTEGEDGCDTARIAGFTVWNPATGAQRPVAVSADQAAVVSECLGLSDAVSNRVVLTDGRVFDLTGATARQLIVRFGPGTPADALASGISADGRTVVARGAVWDSSINDERTYLSIAPTDGTTGQKAIRIDGLKKAAVSGTWVHYLVGTKHKLAVCRAALAKPTKPSCVTLRKGDNRSYEAFLDVSQGVELVTWTGGAANWIWLRKGSTLKKLKSNSTVGSLWGTSFRDPARPLVSGVHASLGDVYGRVGKSLKVDWSIRSRKVPTTVADLALTPDRVVAIDSRPYPEASPTPLWYRTFAGSRVGAEVRLSGPVDTGWEVFASGARAAADCCTSLKTKLYDGSRRVFNQRLKENVLAVSGPYVATRGFVRRYDGVTYATASMPAIFGSLVATLDQDSRVVTIRDLARPSAPPVAVTLAGTGWADRLQLWGDWISVSWEAGGAQVMNYRTGETHAVDGRIEALGDGYALVFRYGPPAPGHDEDTRTALLWSLPGGELRPVPVADGFEVAIDGVGRVAWVTGSAIKVADVPGAGTSGPRLLGGLAKAAFTAGRSWKLDLDASEPLRAGRIEIRDAAGKLVRSIATKATASGSLRGLTWNGRDAAGKKVRAGTYTWILRADAADGTGTVTDVTGLGA
ncbi:MAG: FlgD immunoglobulin-like domain containing protein, partial [Propionicimonas sp.]|nr:FlgD immunoglobulin-like domain containing protein [Propionicimonas sp.]